MFGLAVIGALGGMSDGGFTGLTVPGWGAKVSKKLFSMAQVFSFGKFSELETGLLINRLVHDVTQVHKALLSFGQEVSCL